MVDYSNYFDEDGNPLKNEGVYLDPSGEIYILIKNGDEFRIESTSPTPQELTPEFAGCLRRIKDPSSVSRLILHKLEDIIVDEDDDLPF